MQYNMARIPTALSTSSNRNKRLEGMKAPRLTARCAPFLSANDALALGCRLSRGAWRCCVRVRCLLLSQHTASAHTWRAIESMVTLDNQTEAPRAIPWSTLLALAPILSLQLQN
eukprot:scaffold1996_cov377-Prasinococcus_capsulatus_cf.AAC.2